VHVCEESHCGEVAMNHSNKDRASSAGSEEGRLRLKKNTLSFDTHPTPDGTERVPRVTKNVRLLICEKNRMRLRSPGGELTAVILSIFSLDPVSPEIFISLTIVQGGIPQQRTGPEFRKLRHAVDP
jgi:hypothetical protein